MCSGPCIIIHPRSPYSPPLPSSPAHCHRSAIITTITSISIVILRFSSLLLFLCSRIPLFWKKNSSSPSLSIFSASSNHSSILQTRDQQDSWFSRILENFFSFSLLDLEPFQFHFHFSKKSEGILFFTFHFSKKVKAIRISLFFLEKKE